MYYNIVFLGPPGSGKGTQSHKLCEKLSIPHISTGDILRATIREGNSKFSDEVKKYVERGELVSDEIVIKLVIERLERDDCDKGYLLDGFPRSLNQAEVLNEEVKDKPLTNVIFIDVDEEDLMKRLTGRRTAKNSGKIYNIYFNPPKIEGKCDETGEDLIIRDDDKPDTVRNRLEVYKSQTLPIVEYYEKKGILTRVDGNKSIGDVFAQIREVFNS